MKKNKQWAPNWQLDFNLFASLCLWTRIRGQLYTWLVSLQDCDSIRMDEHNKKVWIAGLKNISTPGYRGLWHVRTDDLSKSIPTWWGVVSYWPVVTRGRTLGALTPAPICHISQKGRQSEEIVWSDRARGLVIRGYRMREGWVGGGLRGGVSDNHIQPHRCDPSGWPDNHVLSLLPRQDRHCGVRVRSLVKLTGNV